MSKTKKQQAQESIFEDIVEVIEEVLYVQVVEVLVVLECDEIEVEFYAGVFAVDCGVVLDG